MSHKNLLQIIIMSFVMIKKTKTTTTFFGLFFPSIQSFVPHQHKTKIETGNFWKTKYMRQVIPVWVASAPPAKLWLHHLKDKLGVHHHFHPGHFMGNRKEETHWQTSSSCIIFCCITVALHIWTKALYLSLYLYFWKSDTSLLNRTKWMFLISNFVMVQLPCFRIRLPAYLAEAS